MTVWEDKIDRAIFKELTGDTNRTSPVKSLLCDGLKTVDDDEFGYQVTSEEEAVKEKVKRQLVNMHCTNCGSTNVERGFYCSWNVEQQKWIGNGEFIEEHEYCNDCQESYTVEERNVD